MSEPNTNSMIPVENVHKDDGDNHVEIPQTGISTENSNTANAKTHSGSDNENGTSTENKNAADEKTHSVSDDEKGTSTENNNTANENTHSDSDDEDLIDKDANDDYAFSEVTNWFGPAASNVAEPGQNTESAGEGEEERPIIYYDEETMKFIEVFRSTHKMRWWDPENQVYVEHFSQAIDDWLNRNEVYSSDDGNDDDLVDGEAIWNY